MPSKSKAVYVFKVGDPAIVRAGERIVNTGKILRVAPMKVVFEGPSLGGGVWSWGFRRKGTRWVQDKRDSYELEPQP
jgi:hypothetical protein